MTQTSPGAAARPVSPHLDVWRWHITMFCSIAHRATGIALYGGALILAGWAIALAAGPDAYEGYMAVLGSIPGKVLMFGLTVSLCYHLASGIRHLVWDTGTGLTPRTADLLCMISLAVGVVGAIAIWIAAALMGAL